MESKKEKLLAKTYQDYLDLMLYDFPVERIGEIVVDDITGYGTTMDEKILEIKRFLKIVTDQREQGAGIEMDVKMTPVRRRISPDEDIALYMDEFDISMLIGDDKNVIPLRLTSVFEFSDESWKLVHIHGSKAVETEGDTWHLDEWKKKNDELQRLVDEKTNDLKQKNRELEIEAALEKVRSRTMAMQHSDELPEAANVLFKEVQSLGINAWSAGYNILEEDKKSSSCVMSSEGVLQVPFHLPFSGEKSFKVWMEAIESGVDFFIQELGGEDIKEHYEYLMSLPGIDQAVEGLEEAGIPFPSYQVNHLSFFSKGFLLFITYEPVPEAHHIFKRFTAVFDQTYTRFLDLKHAEEQAREAQIEAALERVRSKAMAMHSSEDLGLTVDTFFSELKGLGVSPHRCGVGIVDGKTRIVRVQAIDTNEKGEAKKIIGDLKLAGHPVLDEIFKSWELQREYFPVLRGEEIAEYYKVMNPQVAFHGFPEDEVQYGYYFYFKEGGVYAWTDSELQEQDLQIFRRYTSVLSLTYRRYLDLKDAEEQARQAVKQSALDRIRAKIASMRNAGDLQQITPLIWNELKSLEVPFFRCGVFIVNENEKHVQVYLATPEGKPLAALDLDFELSDLIRNTVESWRKKETYQTHWNKEEFIAWTREMMKLRQIETPEEYQGNESPPESLHLHFIPFAQGMLYVGHTEQLDNESIDLVKSLADAFSFAYARYEDFVILEEAKERVEKALTDLKATQSQLIHAEKMASLGELTAGIAHEIQNPLNFVNNFSEVSVDLIDEMKEELTSGEMEEVSAISDDLKQNLEKITFHGQRASTIVKGMLEHSRAGNGHKEPTNINELADEYLRLAYHGLRAKDKSFNADFKADLDTSLPEINVIPQDLGRVLLNLINNAFYAVSSSEKRTGPDYKPMVIVETKIVDDQVKISIKDNGDGIPADLKEKIFQPFFTTKPSGKGTGLGLSLSFDIIKNGHHGDLTVESKHGEGTEFTIVLPIN